MRVLVTGAAGFVGSHLVDACVSRGYETAGVDNFATSGGTRNLKHALRSPLFRFIEADVSRGLPAIDPVDVIFHFASPASPKDYAAAPIATLEVNSYGTQACCEAAARCGARLVYASTSEIYGDPLEHPQQETYWGNVNSVGERSCYDEGKRFGEAMTVAYRRAKGVDARIVRIFNTYGPRMRANDGRVVPALIGAALRREPFTIFGDGSQTRCLCYVDDLVEGILRFAAIPAPAHRIVNLGSDHELPVLEIARAIARLCDVPCDIRTLPLPADDPTRRRPDLSRAEAMLGWSAQTNFDDGMRRTIEYFRHHLDVREGAELSC